MYQVFGIGMHVAFVYVISHRTTMRTTYCIKQKYTPAVRSKICGNSSLQAVCDTPIARITGCVRIKDIGRRLPLELQCSLYQGQQGGVSQSVRGNNKNRFRGGHILTAVEENASVYQVYPVSRITRERRAEFLRARGPGFEQEGAGGGGLNLCVEIVKGDSICAWKL